MEDVMSRSPLSVVAVSNDALRSELLDRLLVDDNDFDLIVVESIARAYSRIRELRPNIVVLFVEIDDVDACQLLSMLQADRALRGVSVLTCTTGSNRAGIQMLADCEERSHAMAAAAS
jgi:chemotaxis response regulator CheB